MSGVTYETRALGNIHMLSERFQADALRYLRCLLFSQSTFVSAAYPRLCEPLQIDIQIAGSNHFVNTKSQYWNRHTAVEHCVKLWWRHKKIVAKKILQRDITIERYLRCIGLSGFT